MSDANGLTPEERAHHPGKARQRLDRQIAKVGPGSYAFEVLKRTSLGVFNDGFIHAGNLAYLALMTLFPFFITTAALLSLFGQSNETQHAVESFLHVLPPDVSDLLRKPIADVLAALGETGPLLARMSGSGATCFALYASEAARDAAAATMRAEWWQLAGRLR